MSQAERINGLIYRTMAAPAKESFSKWLSLHGLSVKDIPDEGIVIANGRLRCQRALRNKQGKFYVNRGPDGQNEWALEDIDVPIKEPLPLNVSRQPCQ